jgi:hypothetical protein
MSVRDARRPIWLVVAALAATTAVCVVTVAGPAGAQSRPPSRGAGICARADHQWARLVAMNQRAKTAFEKAQAFRNRLIRAGRVGIAHRLDTRLAHLRQIHATLVARAEAVAARVQGRCSDRPPTLSAF